MAGQRKWAKFAKKYADSVENDVYGTTWATAKGAKKDAPTVMIEAHADEIGFMISYISSEGLLTAVRVGGTDHAIARGKRVVFNGDKGDVLGVVGNTAIHIRGEDKVPEWEDLFIDIGATSKEEVLARGLRVGHVGVYDESPLELTEKRLIGRAIDNRIGGYIITQVLKRLKDGKKHIANVCAVNAVQEEIGGNGAKMAAYRLHPDVALVIDVTHATDTPGVSATKHGEVKLGGGVSISHGTANHPLVVQRLMEIAEKESIPIQHEASSRWTGTDADDIFTAKTGVPTALISLPMRYMHSPVEMIDTDDLENVIRLMTAFVQSVKAKDYFGHRL